MLSALPFPTAASCSGEASLRSPSRPRRLSFSRRPRSSSRPGHPATASRARFRHASPRGRRAPRGRRDRHGASLRQGRAPEARAPARGLPVGDRPRGGSRRIPRRPAGAPLRSARGSLRRDPAGDRASLPARRQPRGLGCARGDPRTLRGRGRPPARRRALPLRASSAFLLVPATLWRLHLHVFRARHESRERRAMGAAAPRPLARRRAPAGRKRRAFSATPHPRAAQVAGRRVPARPDERAFPAGRGRFRARPRGRASDGVSLFLVSALSLRFAYPSVSSDGRAPRWSCGPSPWNRRRQLLARWAVRALPRRGSRPGLTGKEPSRPPAARPRRAAARSSSLSQGSRAPALHVGLERGLPHQTPP